MADSDMESTSTSTYDWSFIDRVYLITCPNADPNGARLSTAQAILQDANLQADVKPFDTDDEDRIRGCYTSHISVLRDALQDLERSGSGSTSNNNPWDAFVKTVMPSAASDSGKSENKKQQRRILVLEDNIAATGNLDQAGLDAMQSYADTVDDWDVIHLAYIPYVPSLVVSKTTTDRMVQLTTGIGSALGTTAYMITEDAIRTLVQQDDSQSYYAAIPDVMAELFPTTRYAAFPTPFLRAPKTKSLVNPQLDDLREILFQPSITSFVQRILAMTGLSTNELLPITIATLLASSAVSGKMSVDAISSVLTTGSYDGAPLAVVALSLVFTVCSLALIVQGAMLAPKPPQTAAEGEQQR